MGDPARKLEPGDVINIQAKGKVKLVKNKANISVKKKLDSSAINPKENVDNKSTSAPVNSVANDVSRPEESSSNNTDNESTYSKQIGSQSPYDREDSSVSPDDNTGLDDQDLKEKDDDKSVADKELDPNVNEKQNTATNKKERELIDDDDDNKVGKGFTDKGEKKRKISIRKKITFSIATAGVTGSLLALFITSPVLLINHVRDLMLGKVNELQTSQQRTYRRKKVARVKDVFSRDGLIGGRVIADMERVGYRFNYGDGSNPNKITGIEKPDGTGRIGDGIGEQMDEFLESRRPFWGSERWKTKRTDALFRRYDVPRVSVVDQGRIPGDIGGEEIDPEIKKNSRLYNQVNEGEIEIRARFSDTEIPEGLTEEEEAQFRESLEAQEADARNSGAFDELIEQRSQGIPDRQNTNPLVKVDQEIPQGFGENALSAAQEGAESGSLFGRVIGSAKSFFTTADLADRVCIVNKRLKTATSAARTYRALAMMRYSLSIIGASDATRRGGVDSEVLGVLLSQLTGPDINGQYMGASPSFNYAVNGRFSKSSNDSVKSGFFVGGILTGVYGTMQAYTKIKGCKIWQNPFAQLTLGVAEGALTFFTGGGAKAFSQGAKISAQSAIKRAIQNATVRSVARGALRIGAQTALRELTFEGIMYLTQMYAEKSISANFSAQEQGANLANITFGGAGVAHKQRNLASGQVPATTQQYAPIVTAFEQEKKDSMKDQSFFARIFDVNNVDSLAWSMVNKAAFSGGTSTRIANGFMTSFLSTPSSLLSTISGNVYAQDSDEIAFDTYIVEGDQENAGITLATDPAGNLQTILRRDIEEIDPEENIEYLISGGFIDPNSEQPIGIFEKHVENCVNSVDTISVIEGGDPDKPEEDCLAELDITVRFKAHLAYLDMMDGLEAAFPVKSSTSFNENNGVAWAY